MTPEEFQRLVQEHGGITGRKPLDATTLDEYGTRQTNPNPVHFKVTFKDGSEFQVLTQPDGNYAVTDWGSVRKPPAAPSAPRTYSRPEGVYRIDPATGQPVFAGEWTNQPAKPELAGQQVRGPAGDVLGIYDQGGTFRTLDRREQARARVAELTERMAMLQARSRDLGFSEEDVAQIADETAQVQAALADAQAELARAEGVRQPTGSGGSARDYQAEIDARAEADLRTKLEYLQRQLELGTIETAAAQREADAAVKEAAANAQQQRSIALAQEQSRLRSAESAEEWARKEPYTRAAEERDIAQTQAGVLQKQAEQGQNLLMSAVKGGLRGVENYQLLAKLAFDPAREAADIVRRLSDVRLDQPAQPRQSIPMPQGVQQTAIPMPQGVQQDAVPMPAGWDANPGGSSIGGQLPYPMPRGR